MLTRCIVFLSLMMIPTSVSAAPDNRPQYLPGFSAGPAFGEQVREERLPSGIRILYNAPGRLNPELPTLLIIYATPNGNSIEQTLGGAAALGVDWHFDIQHIAAQTRVLRELDQRENIVLACVEAPGKSWPAWRHDHADNATTIRSLVEGALNRIPGHPTRIALTGHSGGGSFIFGFINAANDLPDYLDRVVFLDANYAYSHDERHGNKLIAWLGANLERRLVVIAYDDRSITLAGKLVVGPDGGTYRATKRMLDFFDNQAPFHQSQQGPFQMFQGLHGQATFYVHPNPENKILHTALVGEMNGFLQAMTLGTPEEKAWGTFGGPRAYTQWIAAAPATPAPPAVGIPARPANSSGGRAFMDRIAPMPPPEREAAILAEIVGGNIPSFLRTFKTVSVTSTDRRGAIHHATFEVMPDYLSVGSDTEWVRVPMTPMTAQRIADAFGCTLPTRKMVDDIYRASEVKLEPRPLTEQREAVRTFVQHHDIIEEQRKGQPLGLLVSGIKKDVVLTNRLLLMPGKVAIYGWHHLDGTPIQPLTTVHRETYVDYSHGIRLVRSTMTVDGKPRAIREVLQDPDLCMILSDEGTMERPSY